MFKKIIYLSFAVFLIMFTWSINSYTNKITSNAVTQRYLYSNSSNCVIVNNNGIDFFVKGESYVIENNQDINEILKFYNAKLKKVEKFDEGINYYAFSNDLKYSQTINGEIVNLHIFIGKSKSVIGTPIIYGSY